MSARKAELEALRNMAGILKFDDDVEHWSKELEKLEETKN